MLLWLRIGIPYLGLKIFLTNLEGQRKGGFKDWSTDGSKEAGHPQDDFPHPAWALWVYGHALRTDKCPSNIHEHNALSVPSLHGFLHSLNTSMIIWFILLVKTSTRNTWGSYWRHFEKIGCMPNSPKLIPGYMKRLSWNISLVNTVFHWSRRRLELSKNRDTPTDGLGCQEFFRIFHLLPQIGVSILCFGIPTDSIN